MSAMRKALDLSEAVLAAICATSFAAMVALGVATVVFRFLIQSSLAFPDELIRYLFIWLVFLGAAIALRRNLHAAIGVFVRMLPGAPRRAALLVANGLSAAFFALMVVYGVRLTIRVAPQISPALEVSMAWVYAAAPAGGALMFVYALESFARQLTAPVSELDTIGG